jgi:hypothetical protein
LGNIGPDEPFGGGEPPGDFDAVDPDSTGQVMQFRVMSAVAADPTTPPQFLVLPALTRLTGGAARRLALLEQASTVTDGPATPTRCTSTRSASRSSTGNTCCWTRMGQFVWHCHIVEHEDNEMRPKRIGPVSPVNRDSLTRRADSRHRGRRVTQLATRG